MGFVRGTKEVLGVSGFSVGELLPLYLKSAICTVRFRLRGVRCSLVGCSGRRPVLHARGHVSLGRRFSLIGPVLPCELGAATAESRLDIGDRVVINQGAAIVSHSQIEIGDDCLIGEFSAIYDTNYHSLDPRHPVKCAPVILGSNVWLCRGVVVLPGSKIGDHTVVAAGSVVKGDLPPRVLAAGNPAQVVRDLDIPSGWSRH